ncbi:MAG: agmatine deiminase family protein [Acidobacteriota bacterium]
MPPEGAVCPGEWEDMKAQIMSWPIGSTDLNDFFCQLVDNIQEYNEVWMIVESQTDEDYVKSTLSNCGVPLTNVIFIRENVDSIWSRDYGPEYMRTPLQEAHITDAQYYWTRTNDDVIPYRIAMREEIPAHEARIDFEGGNFQSDGYGHCFYTDGVYEANSTMTPEQVDQVFRDYYNCKETTALQRLIGEGTGHIDMFAKLLSPTKWIVGQYPVGDPNYQVLEDNAALLASLTAYNGQPYEVIRIPMPPTTPTALALDYGDLLPRWDTSEGGPSLNLQEIWRTHTNSTIADALVLVPIYGKGTDEEALQIYSDAMPGHVIVGIDSEAIIPLGGAMHCVTMQVPEYPPYDGLAFHSIQDLSEVTGNGNGAIDPGETWEFNSVLWNHGSDTAGSVSARIVLNSSVSSRVIMLRDSSGYPDIQAGGIGASSRTYRFALDEAYPCGEPLIFDLIDVTSSLGEDPDQPRSLKLNVGSETVITRFWDDMESGSGGWTHGPISGATDLWHQQNNPGCFPAGSPTVDWAFNETSDCNYATGNRAGGNLTSQTISEITASSRFYFDYWRETDFCSRIFIVPAKDFFSVEASDNGFITKTTLLELSCKQPSHAQWLADGAYDLSSFAGKSIQIRFVFDSSDADGNRWRGIGIDDVLIEDRTYSCSAFTPPLPGEVPEGPDSPGEPVTIRKSGTNLIINWDMECNAGYSTDYAIYRGNLSSLSSGTWDHIPVVCTDTGHDLTETFDAGTDSYYFLVAPHDGIVEGSYGKKSDGEARPASSSACYPAGGGSCQ